KLGGIEVDIVHDHDDLRIAPARIEPERAGPARDEQANVPILFLVDPNRLFHDLGHFFTADRDFEGDRAGTIVKAVAVLFPFEDAAVIDADAFKNAVAVEQAVIVYADFGLGFVVELAVNPDAR